MQRNTSFRNPSISINSNKNNNKITDNTTSSLKYSNKLKNISNYLLSTVFWKSTNKLNNTLTSEDDNYNKNNSNNNNSNSLNSSNSIKMNEAQRLKIRRASEIQRINKLNTINSNILSSNTNNQHISNSPSSSNNNSRSSNSTQFDDINYNSSKRISNILSQNRDRSIHNSNSSSSNNKKDISNSISVTDNHNTSVNTSIKSLPVSTMKDQGGTYTLSPTNSGLGPGSSVLITTPATVLCCDKCDGKHLTDDCPYYKKARDQHPDAQKKNKNQLGCVSTLPGQTLKHVQVIRQPGDGSCLFHSMAFGLGTNKYNANKLRAEICAFIQNNPHLKISDTPLEDWVKWDSGTSVGEYARKMNRGSWGGGIEMACVSQMKECNVHVYERVGAFYKRISAFDHPNNPEKKPVIRVLYCGGVHYGIE